jgi:hypothetical protein
MRLYLIGDFVSVGGDVAAVLMQVGKVGALEGARRVPNAVSGHGCSEVGRAANGTFCPPIVAVAFGEPKVCKFDSTDGGP